MTTTIPRPITEFDPIPFRRLLRVEWGKATDTRAAAGCWPSPAC